MFLWSEAKMEEIAGAHIHQFPFPPSRVAAFKLPTETSPWLMLRNYCTVQENASGCQLKPCQEVC